MSFTGLIHVRQDTSLLGVLGGLGVRCHGHKNVRGVESDILLRTEVAEGVWFRTRKTIGVKEVHLITNDLAVRRR